jgi:DNA-binding LacI/PurR family transcriptional regulator
MERASLSRRPRQTDIARVTGVSVSTVSRVLTNELGVSTDVRDQVIRIASELGYHLRPIPAAKPQNQRLVAIIPVGQATGGLGAFYEGILTGLRGMAARMGGGLVPRLFRSTSLSVAVLEQMLSEAHAAGVFLVGIDPPEDVCTWLKEAKVPTVLVNGSDPDLRFDCVSPANFYGAQLATQHLIAAGHKRLLYFTDSHRHTICERIRGFEAAARRQLSIPRDFSVIGFDDLPCASLTSPRLTTMRVDREAIGEEAYQLMQRRIRDPGSKPRKAELAVSLVQGATVNTAAK